MMRSTFSTPYDEEFAKICIALKFPELKWNLTLQENDPPDLADTDNSVSVEVVSAVTEIDAELLNSYAKYSNYNVQELQPKLMKKINGDCSGFICDDEDNIVGASGAGSDDLCEVIKVRVIRKTEKLNSDRHPEFKTNCIFVYNPDRFCFEDGLQILVKEIEDECQGYARQFDLFFIYCSHSIFLFDRKEKNVTVKQISDEEIEEMRKESLKKHGREEEYYRKNNFLIEE